MALTCSFGPVDREGAAVGGDEHNGLASGGDGFGQILFRLGQIEAGAIAALEAGSLTGISSPLSSPVMPRTALSSFPSGVPGIETQSSIKILFRRQAENSCLRGTRHPLFRQVDLSFYTEVPGDPRGFGIRLTAADADGVIAAGDNRTAVLRHHAQVPTL